MTAEPQPVPQREEQVDVGLLRRVADGDRGALVALYERHGGMVAAQLDLVVGIAG